jgi:hypothetical protein
MRMVISCQIVVPSPHLAQPGPEGLAKRHEAKRANLNGSRQDSGFSDRHG